MKKYLVGIAALMLAIGFSSFTLSGEAPKKSATTDYLWFTVSYASPYQTTGAILTSNDKPFGDDLHTQSYADANDDCSGSSKDCLRGFESANVPSSFPYTGAGSSSTRRN